MSLLTQVQLNSVQFSSGSVQFDCENNHDYKIVTLFDEKFIQKVMFN